MNYHSVTEMMSVFEASGIVLSIPRIIRSSPKGDNHTIIVIPGFCAGRNSTLALRYVLKNAGYTPIDWGQGLNLGPDDEMEEKLYDLVLKTSKRAKVTLIGWSLGGLYARAVANLHPERIRRVITLGTPHAANHNEGHIRHFFDLLSPTKTEDIHKTLLAHSSKDPPLPLTSIYTKEDGVVNWKDCISDGPLAENIQVRGSHMGLTHNPDVYRHILKILPSHKKPVDNGNLF